MMTGINTTGQSAASTPPARQQEMCKILSLKIISPTTEKVMQLTIL
jgi:hypothetical protein